MSSNGCTGHSTIEPNGIACRVEVKQLSRISLRRVRTELSRLWSTKALHAPEYFGGPTVAHWVAGVSRDMMERIHACTSVSAQSERLRTRRGLGKLPSFIIS